MRLYTTLLSANGRKVLAACRFLGVAVDVHEVNVYAGEGQSPDYLAVNPSGKIPTLVDGAFTLTESNAILQYLCEAHGDHRLTSRDVKTRAQTASWLFWESAHWQPTLSEVLAATVGHLLLPNIVPAPASEPDWCHAELVALLLRLERHLAQRAFLVGDELTIADLAVAGMTTYFRATGFPAERYPHIAAWCGRLDAVDAWRETATEPWDQPPA